MVSRKHSAKGRSVRPVLSRLLEEPSHIRLFRHAHIKHISLFIGLLCRRCQTAPWPARWQGLMGVTHPILSPSLPTPATSLFLLLLLWVMLDLFYSVSCWVIVNIGAQISSWAHKLRNRFKSILPLQSMDQPFPTEFNPSMFSGETSTSSTFYQVGSLLYYDMSTALRHLIFLMYLV
jgi:hypothetical protein